MSKAPVSRNVYLADASVTEFVDSFRESGKIEEWLRHNFRNWAINNAPAFFVNLSDLPLDAPEWAKEAAIKRELYTLKLNRLRASTFRIIDYLRFLEQNGKSFDRLSVPDAMKHEVDYHEELSNKNVNESQYIEDGIKDYLEVPPYKWVRVFGRRSLDREGDLMGHCVGSYFTRVNTGHSVIYSLRDSNNTPHVTLELQKKFIMPQRTEIGFGVNQIKGRANGRISEKYLPACKEFLLSTSFTEINLDECLIDGGELLQDIIKLGHGKPVEVTERSLIGKRLVDTESDYRVTVTTPSVPTIVDQDNTYPVCRKIVLTHCKEFTLNVNDSLQPRIYASADDSYVFNSDSLKNLRHFFVALKKEGLCTKEKTSNMLLRIEGDHRIKTQILASLRNEAYCSNTNGFDFYTSSSKVIKKLFERSGGANAVLIDKNKVCYYFVLNPAYLTLHSLPSKEVQEVLMKLIGNRKLSVKIPNIPKNSLLALYRKFGVDLTTSKDYTNPPSSLTQYVIQLSKRTRTMIDIAKDLDACSNTDEALKLLDSRLPQKVIPEKKGYSSYSKRVCRTNRIIHNRKVAQWRLTCCLYMTNKELACNLATDPLLSGALSDVIRQRESFNRYQKKMFQMVLRQLIVCLPALLPLRQEHVAAMSKDSGQNIIAKLYKIKGDLDATTN